MTKASLNTKIYGIVGGLAFSCFLCAGAGYRGMSIINTDVEKIAQQFETEVTLWNAFDDHQKQMLMHERDLLLESSEQQRRASLATIDQHRKELEEALVKANKRLPDSAKGRLASAREAYASWWKHHLNVREALKMGSPSVTREAIDKGAESRELVTKLVAESSARSEKTLQAGFVSAREDFEMARLMVLAIAVLGIGAGLAVAFYLMNGIHRSIREVVSSLTSTSEEVGNASMEVAQSSSRLSSAATEQAASLAETASSSQQLNSMVQRNLETSRRALESSETSRRNAERGKKVVEEMSKAISEIERSNNDIMAQVEESNRQISEITRVISEIGTKTRVINDIVFQTKLLSFNASVEAARAGEHGKGFAVVAEEVGNLARMSGEAAKEIGSMLDSSLQRVDSIVSDTKSKVEKFVYIGKERVDAGNRIARECASVLDEIVQSVGDVTRMSSDISHASQEQAQGVQEINRAVTELDNVTQANAAASEEAARSADHLSKQASALKASVNMLLEMVHGEGRGASSAEAATPSSQRPSLKVVSSSPERKAHVREAPSGAPLKAASGSDIAIPAEDDPRFKDI